MEVYEINISKEQLESLPEKERTLVIQFGHVCNELSFLNKLLLMTSNTNTSGVEKAVMASQSMIVARIFIGKVFEAWEMVKRDFFASKLSKEIEQKLPEDASESLKFLKKYFGKKCLIGEIRNNFSFHYNSDQINSILDSFDYGKQFKFILSESNANTHHSFAEEFISFSILNKTQESTPQKAMDKVIGDLVEVSGKMMGFLSHSLSLIFILRLGKSWDDFDWNKHDVDVSDRLDEYKIPLFFNIVTSIEDM